MTKSSYDIIIVGAGSVGVPSAYFLARKGLKVLCLDKCPSAGQGQNKAAIGGVRATHSDPAKIGICRQSLEIFSRWKDDEGAEIGWKKGGYCFPVYREKEESVLKGILPIQKKFNLNIDWHPADRIRDFVPGINPEGLIGGTFSPDDGQVSPLLAISAFENAAKKYGAEFRYGEEVTGLVRAGNRVAGVSTPSGTYHSGAVLNAAGANAREIAEFAGLDIPVVPDSHEAGISAPVKEFLGPLVVDLRPGPEGKTSNFYFGQNHDNSIIFCYTPKTLFIGTDRNSTSEFMPIIAARLVNLIPRLKNLRIRRLWRGLYPMSPDGVPIVGKAPGVEGLFLAVGLCGQGFMMGPGLGLNIASLVTEGRPVLEEDVFSTLSPARNFSAGKTESLK